MKNFCIVSDFDGTISKKDGLYSFICQYAVGDWEKIEQDWVEGKINSKQCLIEEFKLIPNLSEELIAEFVENLGIDEYFAEFYNYTVQNNIDFYIVSDGIDYFIERILNKHNLNNIKIISNHGSFRGESFEITFPNDNPNCINHAGTCKCNIIANLRDKYDNIIYIGDGVSDYCVSDKADTLFAKSRLAGYCIENSIRYIEYNDFGDILKEIQNKNAVISY